MNMYTDMDPGEREHLLLERDCRPFAFPSGGNDREATDKFVYFLLQYYVHAN